MLQTEMLRWLTVLVVSGGWNQALLITSLYHPKGNQVRMSPDSLSKFIASCVGNSTSRESYTMTTLECLEKKLDLNGTWLSMWDKEAILPMRSWRNGQDGMVPRPLWAGLIEILHAIERADVCWGPGGLGRHTNAIVILWINLLNSRKR